LCPQCGALERHRLIWLYLTSELGLGSKPAAVLHFAPEPALEAQLARMPAISYVSGDIDPEVAMEQMDITAIPRPDDSFDLVLCSHVLEHVPDDALAMREMRRVLKPGGAAVLQHPIDPERAQTYEDRSIETAAGRLRAFNQEDHVRIYGADFGERLERAGFAVTVERYLSVLSDEKVARHGLAVRGKDGAVRADDVYLARKPVTGSGAPA
jgi:SAM-dependent methyltransferase